MLLLQRISNYENNPSLRSCLLLEIWILIRPRSRVTEHINAHFHPCCSIEVESSGGILQILISEFGAYQTSVKFQYTLHSVLLKVYSDSDI